MKGKIQTGLFVLFSLCLLTAYASTKSDLERDIEQADTTFFNAFNACDITTMAGMFSEELEFFHDTAGLSDYQSTMQATKENCSKQLGLVRTLLPQDMEIYPIKGFGAVHMGKHQFCHMAGDEKDCGTFGFMHIWKQSDSGWLIHRVISYGH